MTRTERRAHQEARAKARLVARRKQLAHVQAQRRQAEQQDRTRRWLRVGQLVDQAGLFAMTDHALATVVTLIGRLALRSEVVAPLEALVWSLDGQPRLAVDGMAQAAPGVPSGEGSGI
jgi:hypothetical protein